MVSESADRARWAEALAENAEVLRNIAARGVDITGSRLVDFAHIFHGMESAHAFAEEASREGYAVEIARHANGDFPWDVKVSKEMIPTVEAITAAEVDLSYFATMHGGRSDGWGFYSPRPVPPEIDQS